MPRIFAFTSGPQDWQVLLADPVKHWRSGYSARTLAHSWEAADGFPSEVGLAFNQSTEPLLADLTPILAVPEFKVPLPGGVRARKTTSLFWRDPRQGRCPSWSRARSMSPSAPPLWVAQRRLSGEGERLSFLLRSLGLSALPAGAVRYQLLHRAASAIITGEQYRAAAAKSSFTRSARSVSVGQIIKHSLAYLELRRQLVLFSVLAPLQVFHCLACGSSAIHCSCKAESGMAQNASAYRPASDSDRGWQFSGV